MEYRCPLDDRLFEAATDSHKPGHVVKGNNGAADTFSPGHEFGGHPDCDGPVCTANRASKPAEQPPAA